MRQKIRNRKKRALLTILILAMTAALFGCSGSSTDKNVSMYDLKDAMAASTQAFGEMTYVSSEDNNAAEIFSNISDMDYKDVEAFFIYYATNGTGNADEIAVIRVKRSQDLTKANESLEAHLNKRKSLYSTYDKSQLKKLEAAKLAVNSDGNCAALIVGDEVDKLTAAFNDYFK